jgi:anti-anti-sigma factor
MAFEIRNSQEGIDLLIDEGVLDRSNAISFRRFAEENLPGSDRMISIDCERVSFIDSSGVGALLFVHNLVPEEYRPIRLKNVTPQVLSVLELVRVHQYFAFSS